MRVVFLGEKRIGQEAFRRLLAARAQGIEVVGAVSNTSAETWWGDNAVYRHCRDVALPFIDNEERNNDLIAEMMRQSRAECLISVQHPWKLPPDIIALVQGYAFNLHLAPLPTYRGFHGCNHAILHRDESFGVSLHWLVAEIDSGEMAYDAVIPVTERDTALSLYRQCEIAGLACFDRLVDDLVAGRTPPRRPLSGEPCFLSRNALALAREIKSPGNAEEMARKARALYFPPFDPAYVMVNGLKLNVVPAVDEAGRCIQPAGA